MFPRRYYRFHVEGTARINGEIKDFDLNVHVDGRGICEEKILAEVVQRLGGNAEILKHHINYADR